MNEQWVVLVNLSSRGRLSPDNARFLGALLVNDLFLAARCRDEATEKQKPFFVYIDEAAEFINEDVAKILTEGRKFGLHLTLAHQDLAQLKREGAGGGAAVIGRRERRWCSASSTRAMPRSPPTSFSPGYDLEEPKRSLNKPTIIQMARTIFEARARGTKLLGRVVERVRLGLDHHAHD